MNDHHTDECGSRYDSTRQAWENIWESASVEVELKALEYRRAKATMQMYIPYLPKNAPVLEAGSGLGAVVISLERMGYTTIGLDYAENALRTTRQHAPSLMLTTGDVHALPFSDNTIGAYLSFGVLEHFEHGMSPALNEAYRVLKPGGVLVLTIPYPNVVNRLVEWRRKSQGVSVLTDDDFYESTYDRTSLVGAVEAAGFKTELVKPTSHSYTLRGLGGVFQGDGYYQTSPLAEALGDVLKVVLPWAFNFTTMVIARK